MHVYDRTSRHSGGFATPRTSTRYLVVHHAAALYATATGDDDVAAIARYHTESRGWPGIGYHEVLAEATNGGPIAAYVVSNPDLQRAHIALRNDECWGICAATNFGAQLPEGKWIAALAERLAVAKRRYPKATIVGHQEIAKPGYLTSCPGTRWPEWKPRLLRQVESLLVERPALPPAVTAGYTELSGLAGVAPITDAQAAAFVIRRGSPYSAYSVREIAAHVWHYAGEAGLDALLVWTQIIHETDGLRSWWAARPRRNSAGLGVTGRHQTARPATPARYVDGDLLGMWARQSNEWVEGISFPTWEHSIRAQVGRLILYTVGGGPTKAQQTLAAYANRVRRLPEHGWGSVATLKALGRVHNPANIGRTDSEHVGWAWPGDEYGASIAKLANTIRESV